MLALLLSFILSVFIFTVFGTLIVKQIKIRSNITEIVFLGMLAANALATILSLFFKVNFYTLSGFIVLSLFLVFYIREELKNIFNSFYANRVIFFYALPFILAAFFISIRPATNYDTGLYHLQTIKWIEEYPVIPGLANLHGRFGFNPNVFILFALTSLSNLLGEEIFSVNFLIFSFIVVYLVRRIYVIFQLTGISGKFLFHCIVFFAQFYLCRNLASPSPDFLASVMPFFIFLRILELAENKNLNFQCYIPVLLLAFYIITVKLATLPVLLVFVFVFIKYRSSYKQILKVFPVAFLIVVPWFVRTVVLTGWLVYPFPAIDLFNFDWKIPLRFVESELIGVTGWGRTQHVEEYVAAAGMKLSGWFPTWWKRLTIFHQVTFVASLVFPLLIFVWQGIAKKKAAFFINAVTITSFAGVIFWFFLAPDFRFGWPFLIIASSSPLLYFQRVTWVTYRSAFILPVTFTLLFLVMSRSYFGTDAGYFFRENSKRIFMPSHITTPQNLRFSTYKIGGILFRTPVNDFRCFDCPLPCTSYPDTTLLLRGQGIQAGFRRIN